MNKPMLRATYLGAATVLFEIGPLRLLTDPVYDPAGTTYGAGAVTLQKTGGLLLNPESLPHINAVLLSHDEHADNLEESARAWLPVQPGQAISVSAAQAVRFCAELEACRIVPVQTRVGSTCLKAGRPPGGYSR
jgi:L-ascorbate metabolism protein UlaG (beta-lactamase superfamily)